MKPETYQKAKRIMDEIVAKQQLLTDFPLEHPNIKVIIVVNNKLPDFIPTNEHQKELLGKYRNILKEEIMVLQTDFTNLGKEESLSIRFQQECNDLIRSAHSIAQRKGTDTNWEAFELKCKEILDQWNPHIKKSPENKKETITITEKDLFDCPTKYKFGEDLNHPLASCGGCKIYEACRKEYHKEIK